MGRLNRMKRSAHPAGISTDSSLRLLDCVGSAWMTQVLYSACELRIPEALEPGPAQVEDIALRTDCDSIALSRLLRAMATLRLCRQQEDGRWVLDTDGKPLLPNHPKTVHAWVLWWGRQLWGLWGELSNCVRSGESARRMYLEQTGYDHLGDNEDTAQLFHRAMASLTNIHADAILQTWDFSSATKIVDVGGGSGGLLFSLLTACPGTRGVLFELPHALEEAARAAERQGLSSRCEFVAGSFFDAVPTFGDVYLLKSVLHNWDDESSRDILANCARALSPHAKLLLIERTLSETPGPSSAASVRSDLNMLVGLGGRERTVDCMLSLAKAAGLAVDDVIPAGEEFTVFATRAA